MFTIVIHPQQGYAQVPQVIARDPELKPMDKALWALLKGYARADGFTTVGYETLAGDLAVSVDTIRRSLKRLQVASHVHQEDQDRDPAGKHLPVRKWLLTDVLNGKVIRRAPVHLSREPQGTSAPRSASLGQQKPKTNGKAVVPPGLNGGAPVPPYIDAPLGASIDTDAETPSGSNGLGQVHQEDGALPIHLAPAPAEGGDYVHASGSSATGPASGRHPTLCEECDEPSQWWANGTCGEHAKSRARLAGG
jgi:hypothetical protein